MIEVRLFAYFREGRGKVLFFDEKDVPDGVSLFKAIDLPREKVSIYLINGFHRPHDTPFQDGDVVSLFPQVAGG